MKTYAGIYVPLTTPFHNNQIDWESLCKLIDYYVEQDVSGIIPCGSTGESSTLSYKEHEEVIQYTVDKVNGRIPVIAGTGSNNTEEAIQLTKFAEQAGAQGSLVVSPYYNRPTDEGIYQYFSDIANNTSIDIIIYNIPARTGSNVSVDVVKQLAKIPNIKGIKEGSGDIQQMIELTHHFVDTDFSVLTGEDTLLYSCSMLGGDGGVMASACICPSYLMQMFNYLNEGEFEKALALDIKLRPLIKILFCQTNPIAVKYAVAQYFGLPYELRSPLTHLPEALRKKVLYEMGRAGLTHPHGGLV